MSAAPLLLDALRVVGVSHHKSPVSLRERLAFRAEDVSKALARILSQGFSEAIILSTCNRVELYTVSDGSPDPAKRLRAFLSEYHSVPEADFTPTLFEHKGADAIRHLLEVTASLDSQILGETEILAQSKEAYRVAAECGSCGRVLHSVFERAFFLSKEVRGDGGIGRSQASVSSASVKLAKKLFELKDRDVLVVGTGEMAKGIVRALKAAGVSDFWVASRTEERARAFAHEEGGKPCQMHHLDEYLSKVDVVLVSSNAPHFIIGPKEIRAVASRRRNRTLCLIDISVPRNVDPAVHELDDTFLYDIDDLEEVARDGRMEREAVAARWRPRLAEEAREQLRTLESSEPRDTAKKLLEHAAAVRASIASEYSRGLDAKAAEAIARALERYQGKLLHGPLDTLKQSAREGGGADTSAWISRLFRLQTDTNGSSAAIQPEQRAPAVQDKPPDEPSRRKDDRQVVAKLDNPVPRLETNNGDVAFAAN